MEKYRAIPEGYMTVGEAARKMGVTVRTMQYYDKEGLLPPSSESEGGRRLYTEEDLIKLHQILSMKHLGFSLDDIKNRLKTMDTPDDVADVLAEQAAVIRNKLESLQASLKEIEALREEVLQMQKVDFLKYADIIMNLQLGNEYYWLIKHFDKKTLDYFRSRFDIDSARRMMEKSKNLLDTAEQMQKNNIPPESEEGQVFAKEFWNLILDFTGGDMSLLPALMEMNSVDGVGGKGNRFAIAYIEKALDVYFTGLGYDPSEDVKFE